jgi:CheY-like chemotaxis protein
MQNVLLIDDDPNQHKIFSFFLTAKYGPESDFESAMNLEEAVSQLKRKQFDVIFLDNRLHPFASYTETIGEIRAASPRSAIYLISAAREQEKFGQVQNHGISDVIDKFDLREAISAGLLG